MLENHQIHIIFFLGIGGIGMSALARYYNGRNAKGEGMKVRVCGYDRTPSALTHELEQEGIQITYTDDPAILREWGLQPEHTMVVRTPAVPADSAIYTWLRGEGFEIRKRSEVLGDITRSMHALCVAGTHGKTTTSTMLAHLLHDEVTAFLGGISMNYAVNYWSNPQSRYAVVEADEYDRSFHRLTPFVSVITAVDPDHLDIYGTEQAYREAFEQYTSLITGALVMKHGLPITPRLKEGVKLYTYGVVERQKSKVESGHPDFYAENIRVGEGTIVFDFHTPDGVVSDIRLGVPVWVNIENAVAAMAVVWVIKNSESGIPNDELAAHLRETMASFRGVQRRFNIHVHTDRVVYIDDYAHHPDEIATSIDSVRRLYPNRKLVGVFQPHLYTRTRDFAEGFARVLSTLDECILLPIYPARELPIEGVSSEMLKEKIKAKGESIKVNGERTKGESGEPVVVEKADLVNYIQGMMANEQRPIVLMTIGAGDIDRLVPAITEVLTD